MAIVVSLHGDEDGRGLAVKREAEGASRRGRGVVLCPNCCCSMQRAGGSVWSCREACTGGMDGFMAEASGIHGGQWQLLTEESKEREIQRGNMGRKQRETAG